MEELSKEKWGAERKMKRTGDWGSGVGTSMKNRCPCETDKCDKSHGKNRESTAYLFGILDAGVRWEMPLFK